MVNMPRHAILLILCLACTAGPVPVVADVAAAPPAGENTVRIEIPLAEGRLIFSDLLGRLCDAVSLPRPPGLKELDFSIDARSTLDRLKIEAIGKATAGAVQIDVREDRLVLLIARDDLESVRRMIEPKIKRWLEELLGHELAVEEPGTGLSFITDADVRAPLSAVSPIPRRVVVLIHGLDDPGWRWRDVIPALREAGYTVGRFEFPNDGPIADAADLLAIALKELYDAGVGHVDIVGHSLGGLAARDVLTRKAYYDGDGLGRGRYPAVDRLIMIGTPNAGTHMARFRGVTELSDHLYRAWHGHEGWIDAVADGRGEGGRDLLPKSVFLRRLNARPLPRHTRHTIIAGRISPISQQKLDRMARTARRLAQIDAGPKWLRELSESSDTDLGVSLLGAAVRGLGDGVVTLDSARLDGVDDFVVLEANHQSIIVNVLRSDRTPPAIPIILDRLSETRDAPTIP